MTIKVFTGSGQFKIENNEDKTEQPTYIRATGGNESIVKEHKNCGTPKCCGMCKTASMTEQLELFENNDRKNN